jgi:hypothetical protein
VGTAFGYEREGRLFQGVAKICCLFPGTFHGSSMIADAEVSKREAAERIAVLRKGLGA